MRAGVGDIARIRWIPGRCLCRGKKGCRWRGMGQVGGCRCTEEGGIKGVPLHGLPRPCSATLPGARAHLTSRSSDSSPGRSPRCPLPSPPLPPRPLQRLSLPAAALGQRLVRARPRAAGASPTACVRAPEPLPAREDLGQGPSSTERCSGATTRPAR